MAVPKVFVSYAHESRAHKAQVLAFATFLRDAGIEVVLDAWSDDARQDWYVWAIREMTAADHVLVIASERYRVIGDGNGPNLENRGLQAEAALLRELVHADRATWLPKVLPVVLPGHTVDQIPLFLQPHTASHYLVTSIDTTGTEELLRVVLRRSRHLVPEVGAARPAPPEPAQVRDALERAPAVNQINGTVHGKVIQADTIIGDIHL
jgi:hypothetical protein